MRGEVGEGVAGGFMHRWICGRGENNVRGVAQEHVYVRACSRDECNSSPIAAASLLWLAHSDEVDRRVASTADGREVDGE